MSSSASREPILGSDHSILAKYLWNKLEPYSWPVEVSDFPLGSALVGGAIRDCLLGRFNSCTDLDLVVPNYAIDIANRLAKKHGGTCIILDKERYIARLIIGNWTIDLANQIGSTLEEDLLRRDFRINAIGLTLSKSPKLLDPTCGLNDFSTKSIIAVSEDNLSADPLRALRGLRLMAELGFTFNSQTHYLIKKYSTKLVNTAPERIQSEIRKIVHLSDADKAIFLLKDFGMLDLWRNKESDYINEVAPSLKNAKHLNSEEIALALPLSRIIHLISDEGLKELRFSSNFRKRAHLLRAWQQRNDGFAFRGLKEDELLKLHQDLEKDLPALMIKFLPKDQESWIKRWRNPNDPLFHPRNPVTGNTLKDFLDIPEGPKLGELLLYLCKERAFGRLKNQEDALQYARSWYLQNYPCCD